MSTGLGMNGGNPSSLPDLSGEISPNLSEGFYRMALDSLSTTMIFTLDRDLLVTYANRASFNFIGSLGFSMEIVGNHIAKVFPPLKPETLQRYKDILSTGKEDEEEINYILPSRNLIAEVKRYPLKMGEEVVGILISVNDITKQRLVEKKLRENIVRFDQVSRVAGEWFWETDASGVIVYSSPSLERIAGYSPEGVVGKRLEDFFSPETEEESTRFLGGLFRRRESFRGFIVNSVSKSGGRISLEFAGEPIFENGTFFGFRGAAVDITDRLEYEENLNKFKLAVENASDHIIITDENGVIIYANEAATKITGYSLKEMIGARPSIWGGLMPREFYENMWRTIKEDKNIFIGEVNNKRKDGSVYVAELRISPVLDIRGEVKFFIGIERDITKAKETDRAKTEFVSLASHQLRTPLSIINWYVSELLSGEHPLSEKVKSYAEEIYRGNRRMIDLVNALLDVSRIDSGSFPASPEPTGFCPFLEDIIGELGKKGKEKNITISLECPRDSLTILLDANISHIIFQNLISNAVKYTPPGGHVKVLVKPDGESIVVSISDSGIGIPKDEKDKIFTKFFRASNAKRMDPDGNGLGLYLVKEILDKVGGNISFESDEGKGSVFSVRLPNSEPPT